MANRTIESVVTTAELAVCLARERCARYSRPRDISADACAMMRAAAELRHALQTKKRTRQFEAKLEDLADKYAIELHMTKDLNGMVVGLRFRALQHVSGFRNLFHLS